jgi:hypothetical protein
MEPPTIEAITWTGVHLAAYFGLTWAVEQLIENYEHVENQAKTPLHIAAERGFSDCVQVLLKSFNPLDKDLLGKTALHYAALNGHALAVNTLIAGGANVREVDTDEKSPIVYAAESGSTEVVALLAEQLIYPKEEDGPMMRKAFEAALENGETEVAATLLASDISLSHKDLMKAIGAGFDSMAFLLLDYDLNINLENNDGQTALHMAALKGRTSMLVFLISNGASLNVEDRSLCTALSYAVKNGDAAAVEVLLRAGARAKINVNEN